jgi:hypothetical protein
MAVPLICVAVLIGCGGSDDANDDRRAQGPLSTAPADRPAPAQDGDPAQATVSLTGCVEIAAGTNQYVLRNVRFQPREGGDAQRDTSTAGPEGITEGAWVRLNGGDRAQELRAYAGQQVTLTGVIADSGRNTIGTSGAQGVPNHAGDASQAASPESHSDRVKSEAGRIARESIANGTAAEVRVHAVESTGERCQPDQRPANR